MATHSRCVQSTILHRKLLSIISHHIKKKLCCFVNYFTKTDSAMNLIVYMQNLSEEIKGRFLEYDHTKSVIVVPLKDGRYQAVQGTVKTLDDGHTRTITFTSKVCSYNKTRDLSLFLFENKNLYYSKFTVDNDLIKVEASVFVEFLNNENRNFLKQMIIEVAETADAWEGKLTGVDIF